jgi:hypothetical protein
MGPGHPAAAPTRGGAPLGAYFSSEEEKLYFSKPIKVDATAATGETPPDETGDSHAVHGAVGDAGGFPPGGVEEDLARGYIPEAPGTAALV